MDNISINIVPQLIEVAIKRTTIAFELYRQGAQGTAGTNGSQGATGAQGPAGTTMINEIEFAVINTYRI